MMKIHTLCDIFESSNDLCLKMGNFVLFSVFLFL